MLPPTSSAPRRAARCRPAPVRARIIHNPSAGSGEQIRLLHELVAARDDLELVTTEHCGHATALAAEALDDGLECVVAAGGDGTINEVVQAFAGRWDAAQLLVLPMGTGNDLARSLGLPEDPAAGLALLDEGQEHRIDLMRLEVQGRRPRYAINVSAGGLSDVVDSELDRNPYKETWGALAYLRAAASVGLSGPLPVFEVDLEWDDGSIDHLSALSVVVANGRTAAGGIHVAPHALLDDGLLDVVVVLAGTGLIDLAAVAAALAAGDYTLSSRVLHRCARSVHISARPAMTFNVDGERYCDQPITFTCLERVMRVMRDS